MSYQKEFPGLKFSKEDHEMIDELIRKGWEDISWRGAGTASFGFDLLDEESMEFRWVVWISPSDDREYVENETSDYYGRHTLTCLRKYDNNYINIGSAGSKAGLMELIREHVEGSYLS